MNYTLIVVVLLIIIVVYFLVSYLTDTSVKIASSQNANQVKDGEHSAIRKDTFTYSVWFNVTSWDTNNDKNIYSIHSQSSTDTSSTNNFLELTLKQFTNVLDVKINGTVIPITDIPIQRWVNVIVTGGSNTVDIYYNGKLISTKVVNGLSFTNQGVNSTTNKVSYTLHQPSWQGKTAKFEYYPRRITPQDAWNIYSEGFGGGIGSLMTKYRMKVSFLKDDIEYNSILL